MQKVQYNFYVIFIQKLCKMKHLLIFSIIFSMFVLSPFIAMGEPADLLKKKSAEIISYHTYFKSYFPRYDGTKNEEDVFAYILQILDEEKIPYFLSDFSDIEEGHSFSRNIEIDLAGEAEETLLIVVPINHPVSAVPEEESWSLAVCLGLAVYLNDYYSETGGLPMTVKVLFAGGEFPPGSDHQLGSEMFLENYYPEGNISVLYFRLGSVPGVINIQNGQDELFSPYWIIDRFAESLKKEGLNVNLNLDKTQLYRLGISGTESMVDPYLANDFSAIEINSTENIPFSGSIIQNPTDWISAVLESCRIFMEDNAGKMPSNWDRHYLYMELGGLEVFLTEKIFIPILLGIFTAILLFVLFFQRRMGKYRQVLIRKFWALLVLFVLIFVFLFIGTFTIRAISSIRRFPGIWQQAPLIFLLIKIAAALTLFAILYRYLKQFPFPKVRSFYSASAILLFLMLMAVSAINNISFVFYFVWPFFWTVLFSLFRNKFAKLFCLVVSPGSLVYGLYLLFKFKSLQAIEFIIYSPIWGNLFITLIILPFTLMVIRTSIVFHDTATRKMHIHGWVLFSFPVAAFITLTVYSFFFNPFTPARPMKIQVHEVIDYELGERKLTAAANGPLKEIYIGGNDYQDISAGNVDSITQFTDVLPELIILSLEKKEFLDRKYYTIYLEVEGDPLDIQLLLYSEDEMVICDSNFPFRITGLENSGEVFIGAFPPNPIEIEIVLPDTISVDAQFIVNYRDPPYDLQIVSENAVISRKTTCIQWVNL